MKFKLFYPDKLNLVFRGGINGIDHYVCAQVDTLVSSLVHPSPEAVVTVRVPTLLSCPCRPLSDVSIHWNEV